MQLLFPSAPRVIARRPATGHPLPGSSTLQHNATPRSAALCRRWSGFFLLWLLFGSPFVSLATERGRPNILFFLTDDQRNDTLGCAGHPILRTPNIDRLAAEGLRFENAFVSHSICWVSRTTLLTGLTARSFGEPRQPDRARADALNSLCPDLIRTAGYRTGFFGKWHAKVPDSFRPADHFDDFESIFRNPYFKRQADGSLRHETDLICDRVIDFLQQQPAEKPFCVYAWFNAAHAEDGDRRPGAGHFPWPPSVDGMYDDVQIPPPRLADPAIYEAQPPHLKASINRERFFWRWDTPEKYQTNIRAYFRMISGIDCAIGRVLEELARLGLAENTIVVYSADNGYYMGNRGFAGKWSHYDESLRVPLIVFDPRLPVALRGRIEDAIVLNLDIPPTLLDCIGAPIPTSYQGRSLRPFLEGQRPAEWRHDMFCEHVTLAPTLTWEGVRGERYMYARYFDQRPVFEFLHDLQSDPDELTNLTDDAEYTAILQQMRARCDQLVRQYGGPLLPLSQRRGT